MRDTKAKEHNILRAYYDRTKSKPIVLKQSLLDEAELLQKNINEETARRKKESNIIGRKWGQKKDKLVKETPGKNNEERKDNQNGLEGQNVANKTPAANSSEVVNVVDSEGDSNVEVLVSKKMKDFDQTLRYLFYVAERRLGKNLYDSKSPKKDASQNIR